MRLYFVLPGEFTMIELAENVKEVSCMPCQFFENPSASVVIFLTKVCRKELFDPNLWVIFLRGVVFVQYGVNKVMETHTHTHTLFG